MLHSSTQHAREWISTEVNRRLLNHYIDGWRANDKEIKDLLKNNELWFVVVANPDGYQYTFDTERLWRKNLRDNDNDGQITRADGVDPNRNYPEHFGYDEEGSSSQISSDTYRGPSAGSEPETQAMMSLFDRADFSFQINYHSFGQWLLYAEGWQTGTPTADDPIYFALSGNRDNPAIPDFEPGLSSDVLYVTNGETTDFAHSQRGTLAWTPELGEGLPTGGGFVFPDDEAQVQAEFERALPFALDVAKSAAEPGRPGVAPRPRDQALLPGERRHLQGRAAAGELHVRVLLRRPAGGARHRPAQPGRRDADVLHQRRPRDRRADRGVDGR